MWMWVVSSYGLVAKVLLEPTEYEVLWAAETSSHALEKGRNSYLCPELNPNASVFEPLV